MNILLLLLIMLNKPGGMLPSSGLPNTAKIEWLDGTSFHFGSIPAGKPVSKVFRFRNLSEKPILVDNVRTTCGCTNSDWQEDPVLPGEVGTITIIYDAAMPKYFRKKAVVWFDGISKPVYLYVEGVVE